MQSRLYRKHARKHLNQADTFNQVSVLDIAYPMKYFESDISGTIEKVETQLRARALLAPDINSSDNDLNNWRNPAKYCPDLEKHSDSEIDSTSTNYNREYKKFSLAQDQEDIWLYEHWFYGMKDGVILESGALNGVTFSNSYFFESYANWTPIHIEADPENYRLLRSNRQSAVNVHAALCSEPKVLHYSSHSSDTARGIIEFMTDSFIKQWHQPIASGKISINDLPTVQCVPIKHLMREINVHHIDIWILDVEGAEEKVLLGMYLRSSFREEMCDLLIYDLPCLFLSSIPCQLYDYGFTT
jgi:FkbM family methyltransferase